MMQVPMPLGMDQHREADKLLKNRFAIALNVLHSPPLVFMGARAYSARATAQVEIELDNEQI